VKSARAASSEAGTAAGRQDRGTRGIATQRPARAGGRCDSARPMGKGKGLADYKRQERRLRARGAGKGAEAGSSETGPGPPWGVCPARRATRTLPVPRSPRCPSHPQPRGLGGRHGEGRGGHADRTAALFIAGGAPPLLAPALTPRPPPRLPLRNPLPPPRARVRSLKRGLVWPAPLLFLLACDRQPIPHFSGAHAEMG
jgi:hypothetical protein